MHIAGVLQCVPLGYKRADFPTYFAVQKYFSSRDLSEAKARTLGACIEAMGPATCRRSAIVNINQRAGAMDTIWGHFKHWLGLLIQCTEQLCCFPAVKFVQTYDRLHTQRLLIIEKC